MQQESLNEWMRDTEVAAHYDVSRPTVWRWAEAGIIPKPVTISPGCTRWSREAVRKRDADREAAA